MRNGVSFRETERQGRAQNAHIELLNKEICASETYKFEGIDLQINHFFSRKSSLLNISLIKCILTFLSGFLGDTVKDWMLHNRS